MCKAFIFVKHFQSANSIYLVSAFSDQIKVIPFPSLLLNSTSGSVRQPKSIRHSLCPHVVAKGSMSGGSQDKLRGPTAACTSGRGWDPAYDECHDTSTLVVLWIFCFVFHHGPNSPFLTLAVNLIGKIAQKDS